MTSLKSQLWELIETHEMPEDAAGTPFVNQLMAENRISRETADVAITEYRKFMFLCATRAERNVPSKAVDLVWHLHMQHSRDYWDVFCKKLGKPVHHTPGAPNAGHLEDYKATLKAYSSLFGIPPKGIWRQSSKLTNGIGLVFSFLILMIGIGKFSEGADILFVLILLSVGGYLLMKAISGFTTQGEYTLTFEMGDPFADDDAGDCGSGDGGGCGD